MPPDPDPRPVLTLARDTPPGPGAPPGLVSVVVLCCGQLEHTRLCAPSVLRFSRLMSDS